MKVRVVVPTPPLPSGLPLHPPLSTLLLRFRVHGGDTTGVVLHRSSRYLSRDRPTLHNVPTSTLPSNSTHRSTRRCSRLWILYLLKATTTPRTTLHASTTIRIRPPTTTSSRAQYPKSTSCSSNHRDQASKVQAQASTTTPKIQVNTTNAYS